ncbi:MULTISPECIES: FAD-binding protein [Comamonadaceae]|uniref:FAD-binding protein n=1 Tax=Comamonadaceae TaxID=80864 RepID=UPI002722E733|nr:MULTISPECIES: FAD-binding protein [Comamonadaceae]MDO9143497.1 FAD-binding protein [Rhodoferax sp.]MDP3193478.1 FAD-binding protein [Rhodoferax sp.]MDP3884980.1 FAD-binding protein [Hydrogenophaga sp.]
MNGTPKTRVSTVTPIAPALVVASAADVPWHEEADVLVVGWGAAGASAAIEARSQGADVIVIDRFGGGGASALSGGVVYAGGGTVYQQQAGYDDSPQAMADYLRHEVNGVVSDDTVQKFCNESVANLQWLEAQGARFAATMPRYKTSYPPEGVFLYYSGNELVPAYGNPASTAKPAPRGHRVVAKGQSGATLFAALKSATLRAGVQPITQASVRRLVREQGSGRVLGVEIWQLPAGHEKTLRHAELDGLVAKWRLYQSKKADAARREQAGIEQALGSPRFVRARRGVVLSTGGYIYNPALIDQHAPHYRKGWPVGGAGCDGSGLRLGQSVGASDAELNNVSAWRFITPPAAWPKGLVINQRGERFCNEQVYGAKLGYEMVENQGGKAWLLLDSKLRWEAVRQCLFGGLWAFQFLPALMLMFKVARKARTLEDLARHIGVDAARLRTQVETANAAARGEREDAFGKSADMRQELKHGSFFAIDISIDQKMFPLATLTLGGLQVNELDGHVRNAQGQDIAGLFAAGRTAIGLASSRYVSGLSLADCIFSGRRAGRAAARE